MAVWHLFFPILDEYDEKGTLRLSVVNLVSMDNSQLTNLTHYLYFLKANTIAFPSCNTNRASVQKLLLYPLN